MSELPGKKFWMVYGRGQSAPTKEHSNQGAAASEAQRLARLHPGDTFVLLESIGACRKADVELVSLNANETAAEVFDDEIPF